MDTAGTSPNDAAANLISITHAARHAKDTVELEFMAVNGSHAVAPYRQAVLWFEPRKVCALSGVVQMEANAPYVHWLERLCPTLVEAGPFNAADLRPDLAAEWDEWLPAYGIWLPLPAADGDAAGGRGGLLLARDFPWVENEIRLLGEWIDAWHHAYRALAPRQPLSLFALKTRLRARIESERRQQLPWWRRRAPQVTAGILLLLCLPVRLSVLAPGELVPSDPAVVRSPLEGVIERFHVKPNQTVQKGQPLFDFDQAQLAARHAVASQALATAEAEYRQSAQQALSDSKSKSQLATLQGKIEERRAEAEFLGGLSERARVLAPRDGIVLLDDTSEWLGRPVATGERVLRIANPRDVEVEAWLPVGDAIPIAAGAPASLYLSASPLAPVDASVRYVSYDAQQRPDGSYAYRVRARLDQATEHRVGLKGTAKLNGDRVPMVYWILRRPLALIRQTLGW
jgi:hypothetical protein